MTRSVKNKPASAGATRYAEDVLAGKILTGNLVRLACQRHINDLRTGKKRGLTFSAELAARAVDFFHFLQLAEGEHAGKPFNLQPWQQFIIGNLFGWRARDGYRRFRTAYIEIGKGNGKSPLAAGIGIYGLVADGEEGAEIYSAAVTRDQAKISFRDAYNMVKSSPALARRVECFQHNLDVLETRSSFRPVSSEGRGLDGKRVHMAIVDELHEHPSGTVVDKMRAGTKGRRQALIFEITNSGYDRHSVCFAHHQYSAQILEGALENDSWFAYVCQLDPCKKCKDEGKVSPADGCKKCDDWTNGKVWIKANPNLGVSVQPKYLQEQVTEALGIPSKQAIVQRLNFCIWTEQVTRWLPMDKWDACTGPALVPESFEGRTCYAGLDLANTSDIAALALVFPPTDEEESIAVLPFFWVPEEDIRLRSRAGVPYEEWARRGFIESTEGDVIDYEVIRCRLNELRDRFNIVEVAYDRWNATQLVTQLDGDGFRMEPFGQGFASMSAPTKEIEKLVRDKKLWHGGNPVLRWMASNVAVRQDPAGNVKMDKAKSSEKIDGMVALAMGVGRMIASPAGSIYDQRGLLVLH